MKVEFLKPDRAADLDKFVAEHSHGSIEQTWNWGVLQTTIPGRDAFMVFSVLDDSKKEAEGNKPGKILASMLVVRQEMGRGKKWLWCPGGPLLPMCKSGKIGRKSGEVWRMLLEACEDLAQKDGDVFLRIEPGVPADDCAGKGESDDFDFGGQTSADCYLPRNTLTIDLTGSEEEILKQMKQKGRYNIRKAEKAGVYVRVSDGEGMEEFYEMLKETAKRDGFHLHRRDFYENFLNILEGRGRLYLARKDHDLLGGMIVTHFGDRATYYFGASGEKSRGAMAPYALQWFAMQEAKLAVCKEYDFLGVAPEESDVAKGEGWAKKHQLAGVTQFKTRFGGKRVNYVPARVFVFRRGWWWAYRVVKWLKR